ncbi:ADP,ATP carrier protein 1 [Nosema granulosis]|uniref:ADP,ATP carrier protein n=1 Tax=Nosema granulosis TaxID=83296 RepID=A0A9P6H381_9MICR|nr:ADP,ATP carrier protein 1 [Nosema granulosis]
MEPEADTSINRQTHPNIPTEQEIEAIANARTGLLSYFKVARCEFPKFFLLGGMFGIIGFIYSFMRILKDMFIMTRQDQNTIMFMKIFYVLPTSLCLVGLIQYMMGTKTVSRIFSIFIWGFSALFLFYGVVFLFEDKLTPSRFLFRDIFADGKDGMRNLNFLKPFFLTINEPLATFIFITAEMWGSLLMAYLFMSFLNESCTINQFTRFIPPLYIITNLALLGSAVVTELFLSLRKNFNYDQNQILCASVFFIQGLLALSLLGMKWYLEDVVLKTPVFIPSKVIKKTKGPKLGFKEGIKIMGQSKMLFSMCCIVLFFNMSFNMIESTYKAGVKAAAIHQELEIGNYSANLNKFDQYMTSISVIALNLSAFSTLVETKGWIVMGLITPIITFLAIIITIGAAIYNSAQEKLSFSVISSFFSSGKAYYTLENYSGIFFLSLLKIAKYAAFDICKEKMGMRLDTNHRSRFKSVYDGIFGKLGKSFSSLYGLAMLTLLDTDNIRRAAPITFVIILFFIVAWFKCISYLSGLFENSLKTNSNVDIDLFEKSKAEEK